MKHPTLFFPFPGSNGSTESADKPTTSGPETSRSSYGNWMEQNAQSSCTSPTFTPYATNVQTSEAASTNLPNKHLNPSHPPSTTSRQLPSHWPIDYEICNWPHMKKALKATSKPCKKLKQKKQVPHLPPNTNEKMPQSTKPASDFTSSFLTKPITCTSSRSCPFTCHGTALNPAPSQSTNMQEPSQTETMKAPVRMHTLADTPPSQALSMQSTRKLLMKYTTKPSNNSNNPNIPQLSKLNEHGHLATWDTLRPQSTPAFYNSLHQRKTNSPSEPSMSSGKKTMNHPSPNALIRCKFSTKLENHSWNTNRSSYAPANKSPQTLQTPKLPALKGTTQQNSSLPRSPLTQQLNLKANGFPQTNRHQSLLQHQHGKHMQERTTGPEYHYHPTQNQNLTAVTSSDPDLTTNQTTTKTPIKKAFSQSHLIAPPLMTQQLQDCWPKKKHIRVTFQQNRYPPFSYSKTPPPLSKSMKNTPPPAKTTLIFDDKREAKHKTNAPPLNLFFRKNPKSKNHPPDPNLQNAQKNIPAHKNLAKFSGPTSCETSKPQEKPNTSLYLFEQDNGHTVHQQKTSYVPNNTPWLPSTNPTQAPKIPHPKLSKFQQSQRQSLHTNPQIQPPPPQRPHRTTPQKTEDADEVQQEQGNAPEVEEEEGTVNAPQKTKVTKTHHLFNFTPHRHKKLFEKFQKTSHNSEKETANQKNFYHLTHNTNLFEHHQELPPAKEHVAEKNYEVEKKVTHPLSQIQKNKSNPPPPPHFQNPKKSPKI